MDNDVKDNRLQLREILILECPFILGIDGGASILFRLIIQPPTFSRVQINSAGELRLLFSIQVVIIFLFRIRMQLSVLFAS